MLRRVSAFKTFEINDFLKSSRGYVAAIANGNHNTNANPHQPPNPKPLTHSPTLTLARLTVGLKPNFFRKFFASDTHRVLADTAAGQIQHRLESAFFQ